jgi:hypothetical protein
MSRTEVRTPPASAPGSRMGVLKMGGGAPASEHRGTAVEAEATLSRRVAAEAEAGKPTVPHACPGGGGERKCKRQR